MRYIAALLVFTIFSNVSYALTDVEISAFVANTHIEGNTGVQGTVSVVTSASDTEVLDLASNGIPDHDTGTFPGAANPNSIEVQDFAWKIPKNPTEASETTCLPQGPIGMAINGVPVFNPYSITCCDTGVEELDLFDVCYGHPAPNPAGAYHYHLNPTCLYTLICNEPSSIIGVAFDGFPIYGPNDEDGTLLTTEDLDECNGKVTNGFYRYHITNDFPYILGCYKGTVRNDAGMNIPNTCTCTTPTIPCTEFGGRRRRKRAVTDVSVTCCVENVNFTSDTSSTVAVTGQDTTSQASTSQSTTSLTTTSFATTTRESKYITYAGLVLVAFLQKIS